MLIVPPPPIPYKTALAASPLVEGDQPCERRQALEKGGEIRLVPLHLDRVPKLSRQHDVDRPVADDLVGDVDVTRLRVARLDGHGRTGSNAKLLLVKGE